MTHDARWYRVVDREDQGWHPAGGGEGGSVWSADYGFARGLDDIPTLEALEAERGPLRPVLPVTDEDRTEIRRLLGQAGRKAVGTVAAALEQAAHTIREAAGGMDSPSASWEHAKRVMRAGREGSWESEALIGVILFGNELNLSGKARGTVEEQRAAGPSPRRVDRAARDQLTEIILRWVTDPDRYTEVAENLASLVSGFADDAHGASGWRHIADQWLQPASLDKENFTGCYGLLYSQSAHSQAGLQWPG